MNDRLQSNARRQRSREVLIPLLVAAGVVGLPVAFTACARDDRPGGAPAPGTTVNGNTDYPMNYFVPGAGYYHAPYHAWFPFPWNYYDASRGWFRGGQWRPAAQLDSREEDEQRTRGVAPFATTNSSGAQVLRSRPSPEAVQQANAGAAAHRSSNVIRGGFGSSSRPAIS